MQRCLGEIVNTHRNTARCDQHIRRCGSFCDLSFQFFSIITHQRQAFDGCAGQRSIRGNGVIIRITNLIAPGFMTNIDKLAARSHHRHARASANFHPRISKRGQRRDHRRVYLFARAQNSLAYFDLVGSSDNRSARLDRLKNLNDAEVIDFARQFNLLHRIGPGWHRSAGHNAHNFARFHLVVPTSARRRLANNAQTRRRARNVRGPKCIPIHLRAIKWRQISVSDDVFGENSS